MSRSLLVPLVALSVAAAPAHARAAPAGGGEADYRALERDTKLDLSRAWQQYRAADRQQGFFEFVDAKYRRARRVGIGLVAAGAVLGVIGSFALSFAFSLGPPDSDIWDGISAGTLGVTAGLFLAGGVTWGVYYKRIERLEAARGPTLARVRGLGPVPLRGGAGVGLQLAF